MKYRNRNLTSILLICLTFLASNCSFVADKKRIKLQQTFETANQAFREKKYDKAIELYKECLNQSPNEINCYSNLATTYRLRGVDLYNAAIKIPEKELKDKSIEKAKDDFLAALQNSTKSVALLKSYSSIELAVYESVGNLKTAVLSTHADSLRIFALLVDKTKVDEAIEAAHAYIDFETNQELKLKTQLSLGKMLIDTFNGQKAVIEFKKILEKSPDNLDALAGIGMALAQSGKAEDFKEAKKYLQKYIELAPKNHPSMETAKEILNTAGN